MHKDNELQCFDFSLCIPDWQVRGCSLLAHAAIPSVPVGATSAQQVTQNVQAGDWKLTPEELAEVDILTRG